MTTRKLSKGLGTTGLGIAVVVAVLHFGDVPPEPDAPAPDAPEPDAPATAVPDAFPPGSELPAIPDLVERAGLGADLDPLVERWSSSWTDGRESFRIEVYRPISDRLVDRMGPEAIERELDRIRRAVEEARRFDVAFLPPALVAGVERADSLEIEARALLRDGRTAEALATTLAAADALRALPSREVAERLTIRAERALRTIRNGAPYSERQARRGERLTLGAREAFDEGEYERAIERAYYACQLLESAET